MLFNAKMFFFFLKFPLGIIKYEYFIVDRRPTKQPSVKKTPPPLEMSRRPDHPAAGFVQQQSPSQYPPSPPTFGFPTPAPSGYPPQSYVIQNQISFISNF